MKLVCPECRRENEPERIYCHDCGARLDRSDLAKIAPKQKEGTQNRLHSMLDWHRTQLHPLFFRIGKLLLYACALAALIQMLLQPDVPTRVKSLELPPQINLDLERALMSHNATPLRYTETQVNAYLGSLLKNKQAALSKLLQFERAVAHFDEGVCQITVERSLFGYSIFTATANEVAVQDGNVTAVNKGGSIGRLPLHPLLMKFSGLIFGDLWQALESERKSVSKMGAIEFHPQAVILTPKG